MIVPSNLPFVYPVSSAAIIGSTNFFKLLRTVFIFSEILRRDYLTNDASFHHFLIQDLLNLKVVFNESINEIDDGNVSGTLQNFEGDNEELIFYVANQEWPSQIGQYVSVGSSDLVYLNSGIVYEIIINII